MTKKKTQQTKTSKQQKKEGNRFDKIFKENIREVFPQLFEMQFGTKLIEIKPVTTKMQTTLEREMDALFEVKTVEGEQFLVNLEFQVGNEKDMIYRINEYNAIALKKLKKPIKHLVVYVGQSKPTMQTKLDKEQQFDGFQLLDIHNLDYEKLLDSNIPGLIIWAIFAKYPKAETENVIRQILYKLQATIPNKRLFQRYLKQLLIFAGLKKVDILTDKIVRDMPLIYDITQHTLYKQGAAAERKKAAAERKKAVAERKKAAAVRKKAEEEIKRAAAERIKTEEKLNHMIRELLLLQTLSVKQIANICQVTQKRVKEMKKELENKKS